MASSWFERVVSMDGTVAGRERQHRAVVFVMSTAGALTSIVNLCLRIMNPTRPMTILGTSISIVALLALSLRVACKAPLSKTYISVGLVVYMAGLLLNDLSIRAKYGTNWPLFVLVVDAILVLDLGIRFASGVVIFVCFWLFLLDVESGLRLGLYDVPLMMSTADRREAVAAMGDCATPPCAVGLATSFSTLLSSLTIFILDFVATRGFASEVQREQAAMAETISVVQDVATCLAHYDVDTAAAILSCSGTRLPDAMRTALQELQMNLRAYRPFLPKSCLPSAADTDPDEKGAGEMQGSGLHPRGARQTSWDNHLGSSVNTSIPSEPSSLSVSHSGSCLADVMVPEAGRAARSLGLLFAGKGSLLEMHISSCPLSTAVLTDAVKQYSADLSAAVASVLQVADGLRGVVDLFVGDRVLCSFNASRQCIQHAVSAVGVAKLVCAADLPCAAVFNIGIATGSLLCGDMGCADMRRFLIVGQLQLAVRAVERAGWVTGTQIACSISTRNEAAWKHDLRLVPRLVIFRRGNVPPSHADNVDSGDPADADEGAPASALYETPTRICEVVPVSAKPSNSPVAQEWMYELGTESSASVSYNKAAASLLQGDPVERALDMANASATDLSDSLARLHVSNNPLSRHPIVVHI